VTQTTKMRNRRRHRRWSLNGASKFLPGNEREHGTAVRIHRFVVRLHWPHLNKARTAVVTDSGAGSW
jgi:hypothetical protein